MSENTSFSSIAIANPYDGLPWGVCVVDRDQKILGWNTTLTQWTGVAAREAIGSDLGERFPTIADASAKSRIEDVFLTGDAYVVSASTTAPEFGTAMSEGDDSPPAVYRVEVRPLAESRQLAAILIEDVTSEYRQSQQLQSVQKQLEAAERQRREDSEEQSMAHAIVESSEDAIIGKALDGTITSWNHGATQLYGYEAHEVIGKSDTILTPPGEADRLKLLFERARQGESTDHFDTVRLRKNGETFEVSLNISPIRGSNGEIVGISTIARDISEQKKIDAALRRSMEQLIESHEQLNEMKVELELKNQKLADATRQAEQASKTKGEFLANMSHEIRTPMTAILGFADVLLAEESANDGLSSRLDALKTIKRNGEYLLELINDILDLSKIEADKLDVECIECSPAKILRDVSVLMRVRSDAKKLPLEIDSDGPFPKTIATDPTRLRQILINLVGNAIKFTEKGKVRVVMRLDREHVDQPVLKFDVIDTGVGMTEKQRSRLFRPFTQADNSTTRKFGGTGLGLTISKRLTDMLGGTITIESEAGVGTTFTVSVATGSLDGVEMLKSLSDAESAGPRPVAKQDDAKRLDCRILLAEDGPDNQRLISFVLKKAGAEVEVADNGQIAVDRALQQIEAGEPFDVILTDMQMPVLDGYGATRKLREAGYTGPIIALTANAMDGDREKCIAAGCDDYTTKPIKRDELLQMVADYAEQATAVAS